MTDPLFSVADQIVLVSGASRGIGRALAQGLAERDARVIISSRDAAKLAQTAKEISTGKHAVTSIACDVSKENEIEALIEQVTREHGRIDTLVNVAGMNIRKRAETYTPAEYDQIIDTNLRGLFLLAQAAGKHMIAQRSGAIINIDSLNTYAPLKGVAPYAMSKAGVLMMTRALAAEWGPHGVRVNTIAPGFFPTELAAKVWAQPRIREWSRENTPLGRVGEVGELVGAAIFLASKASSYVTGHCLRVDGGMSAGINWPIEL
jgi:gluconate 5-dehydrogenase